MKTQNLQQKNCILLTAKTSGAYSKDDPIKFLTKSIESSLWDYSDAYILVTENITSGGNDTNDAFKNSAPFRKWKTEIIETFVGKAEY